MMYQYNTVRFVGSTFERGAAQRSQRPRASVIQVVQCVSNMQAAPSDQNSIVTAPKLVG